MSKRQQPKERGQRSRAELATLFSQMYAGWDRGVNMEGPDAGFRETPMTAMELEARYVGAEIGINIFEIANSAAFAPIIIFNEIQKVLGPLFAQLTERALNAEAGSVRLHKLATDRWVALLELRTRDIRNGSLPAAYREIVDSALGAESSEDSSGP